MPRPPGSLRLWHPGICINIGRGWDHAEHNRHTQPQTVCVGFQGACVLTINRNKGAESTRTCSEHADKNRPQTICMGLQGAWDLSIYLTRVQSMETDNDLMPYAWASRKVPGIVLSRKQRWLEIIRTYTPTLCRLHGLQGAWYRSIIKTRVVRSYRHTHQPEAVCMGLQKVPGIVPSLKQGW
eukprot:1158918-Pelagomonas_calceolata.AAC.11